MTTLTKDTKFPAYVVWFLVVIAIGGATAWADLRNQIRQLDRDSMTQQQFKDWSYAMYRINHSALPSLELPPLPEKIQ